jgi:hypothetical protein
MADRFDALCSTLRETGYVFDARSGRFADERIVVVMDDGLENCRLSNELVRAIGRLGYVIRQGDDDDFVITRPVVE